MSRFYLKKKVTKSNRLIHAREEKPLTVLEQKIFLLCATALKYGTEDKEGYITIPFSEIYETPNSNNYRDIRKACKSLITSAISIEEDDDDGNFLQGDYKSIFAHIKAHARKGTFQFQFNSHIAKELKGMSSNFTQYVVENAFNFTKVHSLKIYELLKEGAYKYRQREFTREELLHELGLENAKTYKTFTKIKDKILAPVCIDISTNSDINVSWEVTGKKGRNITHVSFFWEYKEPEAKISNTEVASEQVNPIVNTQIEQMRAIGLTDAQIEAVLSIKLAPQRSIIPVDVEEIVEEDSHTDFIPPEFRAKLNKAEIRLNELGLDQKTIQIAISKYKKNPMIRIWPEINAVKMAQKDGQNFPNIHTLKKWILDL